jgi:ABC-type enterochelin transport system substrate-binding protein
MEAMDRAVARGAARGPALRRAVTESIIRTALGKTQVDGNPTRVTVTGKDSLENYKGNK